MQQTSTSKFRDSRLERGWTLPDLAVHCTKKGARTDDGNLSRIERGFQVPRPQLRAVLAELLELDVNDFDRRPADGAAEEHPETPEATEPEGAKGRQQGRPEAEVAVLS